MALLVDRLWLFVHISANFAWQQLTSQHLNRACRYLNRALNGHPMALWAQFADVDRFRGRLISRHHGPTSRPWSASTCCAIEGRPAAVRDLNTFPKFPVCHFPCLSSAFSSANFIPKQFQLQIGNSDCAFPSRRCQSGRDFGLHPSMADSGKPNSRLCPDTRAIRPVLTPVEFEM